VKKISVHYTQDTAHSTSLHCFKLAHSTVDTFSMQRLGIIGCCSHWLALVDLSTLVFCQRLRNAAANAISLHRNVLWFSHIAIKCCNNASRKIIGRGLRSLSTCLPTVCAIVLCIQSRISLPPYPRNVGPAL